MTKIIEEFTEFWFQHTLTLLRNKKADTLMGCVQKVEGHMETVNHNNVPLHVWLCHM